MKPAPRVRVAERLRRHRWRVTHVHGVTGCQLWNWCKEECVLVHGSAVAAAAEIAESIALGERTDGSAADRRALCR